MNIRIQSERPLLKAGIASSLSGTARMTETEPEHVLILECPVWCPEKVRGAVSNQGRPVILWMPVLAPEIAMCALEQGVRGILSDESSAAEAEACVLAVARGEVWVPARVTTALFTRRVCNLTPREGQLLTLIAKGLRNKEIAWQMNITEGTVKVYLSRLFDKVGVSDRFELAILALSGTSGVTAERKERTVFVPSPAPAMVTFAAA